MAGSTARLNSSRDSRSAMFSTIRTCTHEWSDMPSRVATVCCISHCALSRSSALAAARKASSLRLPRVGASTLMAAIASAGLVGPGGGAASASAMPAR